MKFRTTEIFLGVFLAVAVFAMGMLFASSYSSGPFGQSTAQRAEASAQDEKGSKSTSLDRAKRGEGHEGEETKSEFWSAKLSDWALVGFTGLLVLFTHRLWKSTDKLWDAGEKQRLLSEDTAKRQLRAYVVAIGFIRTKDPGKLNKKEGFAVLVDVKNCGQTPASDALQWANIAIREFPLVAPLPFHCLENPTRGILPPGEGAKNVMFPAFDRDLTTFEENAILANHTAIYIYGEIEYADIFGDRHLTQFRFRCNGQGYPLGMFKPDGEGNSAT